MVTDQFGSILQELAIAIKNPGLQVDKNNSCLIKFKGGLKVQIELDRDGKNLIIGADLGLVPPGNYRERVFIEALKANGLPYPRIGTFAYSTQNDHLVLFAALGLQDLRGDKVAEYLKPFLEKLKTWKDALARSDVPVVAATTFTSKPMGMFGMRP